MTLSFHGAARTVTGTKHIITLNDGRKVLLDCGMFQGLGTETEELNKNFGFDPKEITLLLLSHAHIDHTGLLPKLVKEGFSGRIICTEATRDLTEILLLDSAEIQTYETELTNKRREREGKPPYEPLYTVDDVQQCLQQIEVVGYDSWISVDRDLDVLFTNTGHLVGSAAITVRIKEGRKRTKILFSGDVGRYRSVLLQPPVEPPHADYIIMESTYGDKRHDLRFNLVKTLNQWVQNVCVERGGQLVIPAFSVGRTQEILYGLNQLSLEKRLPDLPVFVDSPLSLKATQTIKKYTEHFNERLQQVLAVDDDPFDFPGLKYVESVEDSRRLVDYKQPCIIISASGTADAGRVRHHIQSAIDNPASAILLVGYCGAKSLGGQLLAGTKEVEIAAGPQKVAAEIGQLSGLSGHGDTDDLAQFLSKQIPEKVKAVFLVHGEQSVQQGFCDRLSVKGYRRIECPAQHQAYSLPLPRIRKRIPVKTPAAKEVAPNFLELSQTR